MSVLGTLSVSFPAPLAIADGAWLQNYLVEALQWIDGLGWTGVLAFVGLYALATVAFVPGSALTLGAGAVFGLVKGTLAVLVGATLGAILAFLVGRYLARGWVSRRLEGRDNFAAIDQAVAASGFKIVLLTRLSPAFPFNLLNYAFGLTGVSLRDYALGSVGMVPGTLLYVYIGSLVGDLAQIGTAPAPVNPGLQWAARLVGLGATLAVTVYITRIARQALIKAGASSS
ncbi:TVP38/TMEM64 family protein [Leptolyngbya sp. BL0902]|uniref:TVP38/TMEM64 family protein n=1 Tax=Leptolyngbya sp. BL0902 TaxID=1115757 RepID=UPI0018E8243E|nr:TVP38/TMEM64 family protein [Leptolyngbya sp. BL0902]